MLIKRKHVLEFQRLYEKHFQEVLSYEEAYAECMDLVILGKLIYSPIYKEDLEVLEKLEKIKNSVNI